MINALRKEFNCDIKMPDRKSDSKVITVVGLKENVQHCIDKMKSLVN